MTSPVVAFRPTSVVARLPPRSGACPLSLNDLLPAAVEARFILPMVRAPVLFVARAALVAAKEARSAVGLSFVSRSTPEKWFAAAVQAADEIAPELPLFFAAEVAVADASERESDNAFRHAYRLLEAGITHLSVDVTRLAPADRIAPFVRLAELVTEREIGLECVFSAEEGVGGAMALLEELDARSLLPGFASVRGLPSRATVDDVKVLVDRLTQYGRALRGTPLVYRGPIDPETLSGLARSPVKVCDDGGMAAMAAAKSLPGSPSSPEQPGVTFDAAMASLEYAAASLSPEIGDKIEAHAYVETAALIERLGAEGSADRVREELTRRLDEP